MSLEGVASAENLLRGKINSLNTLVINAYDLAVKNGFEGTEAEWLASLKGDKGDVGVFTLDGEKTNIDMDGFKVTGLGNPTENSDAVSLEYANMNYKPKSWMPTASEVGAVPASHATDKDNPHGVTAAQVGAVPAIESTDHPGCYYRMVGGNTEWINPPMVIGGEYRTTERWNGKVVYTKLIDLGIVPAGEKEVDTGIFGTGSGNNGFIRHYAFTATGRSVLPHGTNVGDWEVAVNIHDGKAGITGGSGIGSNNELLYLQMWYIKP